MHDENDEVYLLFIEESQEHLADIESDLLELEQQMNNPDDGLVNKLFRAVHTVKGGAGFFGLSPIQKLAHAMENVLGMVRSGTLNVSKSMVSALLSGADVLSTMVNEPETVDSIEVTPLVEQLSGIVDSSDVESADPSGKTKLSSETVDITLPDGTVLFTVPRIDILNAQNVDGGGNYIYLVKYDLYKDIENKGRTPQQVVKEYLQLTYFIESYMDFSAMGTLDSMGENPAEMPFYVLCATVMDPLIMGEFAGIPSDQVILVFDKKITINEENSVEVNADENVLRNSMDFSSYETDSVPVQEAETVVLPVSESTPKSAVVPGPEPTAAEPAKSDSHVNAQDTPAPVQGKSKDGQSSTVRIAVNQLEVLMNLAGELVLTRNELLQKVQSTESTDIYDAAQKVDAITSELQEAIMVTRMQSVGIVFGKFRRVVRDLAGNLKKQVDLIIEGEDVELDRSIVEAIGDPLTHMVRNSIDHGIESPAERLAKGKPETGTLRLTAMHKAGQVIISIVDDGAGIDPYKIGEKAIEKGLITEEAMANMGRKELMKMIFKPGFSTAEKVTDLSGRGVGMDVVLSSFTKVGGVVDIDSEPGKGTEISIKLPLTLAIIPSLLLEAGGERFAIPQVNLVELVRIRAEDIKERIEWVGDAAVLRLRGNLLPLIRLTELLGMPTYFEHPETGERELCRRANVADRRSPIIGKSRAVDEGEGRKGRRVATQSAVNIAVVASGNFQYGIIVDSLLDSEEIVVKPLGSHLKGCDYYAGATILGDGHVAMILDITSIQEHSVITSTTEVLREHDDVSTVAEFKDVQSFLSFQNSAEELFSIPMVLVTRIEKVAKEEFINVGGRRAMQYRGDTLIILALRDLTSIGELQEQDAYNVIVFRVNNREYGLMVGEVHDTIQFSGDIDGESYIQPGIMGTFIYDGHVNLLVDLYGLAKELLPDLIIDEGRNEESELAVTKGSGGKVLVVEDSKFFLHQIESVLIEAGLEVYLAMDGQEGLAVLDEHKNEISLVVTDIEMPVMDGLEMTREIRERPEISSIPVIAVSSLSGEEAERNGRDAGITEYLVKMDKEQIIESCKRHLQMSLVD